MNARARRGARDVAPKPAAVPFAPLAPRHPALLALALVVAGCLVADVTWWMPDPDLFQHLAVGRVIWSEHRIPLVQEWSWPTFGAPDVNGSWGFDALLWPFWKLGEAWGLAVWRSLTTLAAFAFAWAAARRLGARGVLALVVVAACGLVYRQRALARPETLAAVLLAAELWILETRRAGGRDRWPWLVAIGWLWANAHVSWWFGFALQGIYLLDALVRGPRPLARGLALALGIGALASLANPFGWRALAAPFDYAFHLGREPLFRQIVELQPVNWAAHARDGQPVLVALWPLLIAIRALGRRFDLAETLAAALFTTLGLASQRFTGVYALVAAPFVARGLGEALLPLARPRALVSALARPWPRAALAALLAIALSVPEWTRADLRPGVGVDWSWQPRGACEFVARHGVRGRFCNPFSFAGWMLWRFPGERDRLPFLDVHQAGTPAIRDEWLHGFDSPERWRAFDAHWGFDAVLVKRLPFPGAADVVERDTSFALVFQDDVAALFVKRARFASLADSFEYRWLPAGAAGRAEVRRVANADAGLRASVAAEARRASAASDANGETEALLGHFAALEDRFAEARAHFERAAAANRVLPGVHEPLGVIALIENRPDDALREFRAERVRRDAPGGLDLRFGQAYQRLGRMREARAAYRAELARGPYGAEAADSLRALEGR